METVIHQAMREAGSRLKTLDATKYSYHPYEHTAEIVVPYAMTIGVMEGMESSALTRLCIAGWFHDEGYTRRYVGNEPFGAESAMRFMRDSDFGFLERDIQETGAAILGTSMKEEPRSLTERALRDADLSPLGLSLSRFLFLNADLRKESLRFPESPLHEAAQDKTEWDKVQLAFMENHNWFTESAAALFGPNKDRNMEYVAEKGTIPITIDYRGIV